jgi:hypothetical protein
LLMFAGKCQLHDVLHVTSGDEGRIWRIIDRMGM